MPALPSLSRRLLRKLGIDRIRKIVDHNGYSRGRSSEVMIDEIVRKNGRDLVGLVTPTGAFSIDEWNSVAVELGGKGRRSFEAVRSELEFRLDPVVQEFDMEERVKDLREDPRAVQRLSQLLGSDPDDILARLKDTHGKTLLGSILPELRQAAATANRTSDLDAHEVEEDDFLPRPEPEEQARAPQELVHALRESFEVAEVGTAWPARGVLRIADRPYEVSVYARMIGSSSRGNPLERRFQNPSQRSPIVDDPLRYELLLGLWVEQGEERSVIVAFDPHRRVGKATRFSLFMPLSLLEQAADTGFATHETSSGETLYAFRPENVGRYIEAAYEAGLWVLEGTPVAKEAAVPPLKRTIVEEPPLGDSLNIRPRVGMYSAFARLNYKPWFALAEFVDNSIQSFLRHQAALITAGHDGPLVIDINIDDNEISVTDRAGGIAWGDFPRAFSPAAPPDDPSGLSEFGLGMKAAACWFSRKWSVRTSALGEGVERSVQFDVPWISREGQETLPIAVRSSRDSDHFTVITMTDLRVRPRGRTLTKIKDHLASIYRVLIADGTVRIRFTTNGKADELAFEQPELLHAPYYKSKGAPAVLWKKSFEVDLHDRKVTGWAGMLSRGSHAIAGFSVFRRGRLIEGSVGETYKPHGIFGNPNSFVSQRIVGEVFVQGFDVSHTKDGIQWHGYEDEIVESIRKQLDSAELPLLDQADGYRVRKAAESLPAGFGTEALSDTLSALSQTAAVDTIRDQIEHPPRPDVPGLDIVDATESIIQKREIRLQIVREGRPWKLLLELVRDPAAPFYNTSVELQDGEELLTVQINLSHEFSVAYLNDNETALQPVVRLVAALALGERVARQSGAKVAPLRQRANEILRALATEELV